MRLPFRSFVLLALSWTAWGTPAQTTPAVSLSAEVLTLDAARAQALTDNPELRAAEAGWRASHGAVRQAGSFLNPTLEVGREDFGGDEPMDQRAPQESVAVTQTVRLGGKRQAAMAAAGSAGEAARADFHLLRLEVLARVEREFAELLGAQERGRILAQDVETAREMVRAVQALVEAGEVSPIEASRAQGEADLAEIDLRSAQREAEAARARLAQILGQEAPRFDRAEGTLLEQVVIPSEASVLQSLRRLPDLTRWDAETRRLESELLLARRGPVPDPTFSVGVRRYTTTGERAYFAAVALPLPLLDRNRGGVVEASARLDQGRLERRAEELRLRSAAAQARSALARSAAEVEALRTLIVPGAERIYGAMNEGYLRGKFGLLDLLEARRSLASSRVRLVDALVTLNQAKAELDRLSASAPSDSEDSVETVGVTP